ncbi:HesA/MoeB/ThiF family protein [Chondromyces crocatus]|uniref:THIF-type NAD/FAD binding fold domain-containing protein n=1 Tax=Chondromyces crocatus TaxID=52 RepID=A0A0K1EE55_CHOCO|nr:HesA/MoeB/ThiF family protein [Chondromyces crocatus]AKT39146.1 uncharacterized protein CMC5_032930 [Chondromyces crocatus]
MSHARRAVAPQLPADHGPLLLIGAGGIGAPAVLALAAAGLRRLRVVDDDEVDLTNLHRQILFADTDVGRPKLDAFVDALALRAPDLTVDPRPGRFTPDTVDDLLQGIGVVLDATDNFASRFLIADACYLAGVPVVHAAAIRWRATVLATAARGAPCYRCLFEDLPEGPAPDCATAGVMGPVCGVSGAIAADRALALLRGDPTAAGHVTTYDGLTDRLRRVPIAARATCALCGPDRTIRSIDLSRYIADECAAQIGDHHG